MNEWDPQKRIEKVTGRVIEASDFLEHGGTEAEFKGDEEQILLMVAGKPLAEAIVILTEFMYTDDCECWCRPEDDPPVQCARCQALERAAQKLEEVENG